MTANKNTESSQGDGGSPPPPPPPPPPGQPEQPGSRNGNTVLKSGPLFISSKGIGWTSWKKRWFILTRTSLIFFRSDPSAISQKGGEVNLTLGGIDLNNSGSVVVKADKKLLTVIFPDGHDGRGFTLKAETLDDLNEWKTALENALAQAPNSVLVGQNGIFKNDHADETDGSSQQLKDKPPGKSLVIGRPILLALEDVDGSPSFLEKALRFIEDHGIKVEGILRQAADVEDVERRLQEYEQGKMGFFSPEEDAHVIGDCVKYVLRELPSSPVPASCCNALLEACRADRGSRVNAMRAAICETFPEPNRRLLQRILVMMQTVASHKAVNRMSTSAVAACMAPLLLRPLLAGDCEIETNFDVGGDGSIQLLKAAAAANHAQAIIITLLEEYNNIFSEGSMSPGLYSDSDECESEGEEVTDDDDYYEEDEHDDATQDSDAYTEDDIDNVSGETCNESGASVEDVLSDNKGCDVCSSGSKSSEAEDESKSELISPISVRTSLSPHDHVERKKIAEQSEDTLSRQKNNCGKLLGDISRETSLENKQSGCKISAGVQKSTSISNGPLQGTKRPTVWGRTSARKNLSMESIDYPFEDEVEIQKLEASKIELQRRISEEVKGNAVLQANLEQRKKALHERRLTLEQDVTRLQEQLQIERDKRMGLEAGLSTSQRSLPVPATIDENLKTDIEEINQAGADIANLNQKFDDLCVEPNQRHGQNNGSMHDSSNQPVHASNNQAKVKDKQIVKTAATAHVSGRSANKDLTMDGADSDGRHESTHSPHNQLVDQAPSRSSRHASSNSKKSSTRSEGANSTTSALTKLTARLNFLKERRSQIADELQNLDKGCSSGQTITNPDKGRGSEVSQSAQNPDKGLAIDGQSFPNSDNIRKSDSRLTKNLDGGLHLDVQPAQILDRVRSEGHTPRNADKVQRLEGQLRAMPRNNTR